VGFFGVAGLLGFSGSPLVDDKEHSERYFWHDRAAETPESGSRPGSSGRAIMVTRMARAILVGTSLALVASLLAFSGCDDGDVEKAQQETRKAKATITTLEFNLAKAEQQITDLKEELNVVRETRDELQTQVEQVVQERDQAAVLAQQAEQVITHLSARSDGQSNEVAGLRRQVEELKAVIADQQALIAELQADAVAVPPPAADVPVVDPNDDR
jgi:predicted RNase H-like nuclease (RuvC/YqgF family)